MEPQPLDNAGMTNSVALCSGVMLQSQHDVVGSFGADGKPSDEPLVWAAAAAAISPALSPYSDIARACEQMGKSQDRHDRPRFNRARGWPASDPTGSACS